MVLVCVPDPPNGPPDTKEDKGNQSCDHQLRRHCVVNARYALDEIGEQADHIIGDCGDRQALHRLLKLQLQFQRLKLRLSRLRIKTFLSSRCP